MISDKCIALIFTSDMIKITSSFEIWMRIVLSAEKSIIIRAFVCKVEK